MATWRDGAAYAPVERPDGFATPKAEPLEAAPPPAPTTPGAVPRPLRLDAQPGRPLAELVVEQRDKRDPKQSFAVTSMLLTNEPGADQGRDPRQPFQTSATVSTAEPPPPTGAPLPPPTGQPLPPPTGQPLPAGQLALGPTGLPYLPQAPYPQPNVANQPSSAPAQPVGPAVGTQRTLILLAAGACVMGAVLAPAIGIFLLVAGGLAYRTRAHTRAVWLVSLIVGGIAAIFPGDGTALTAIWVMSALGIAGALLILGLTQRR